MADPKTIQDSEIVALLKSEDAQQRRDALRALYGKDGALLVQFRPMSMLHACSENDALKLFTALLILAQNVGINLGMKLDWTQHQPQQRILDPQGGAFR